MKIKVFHKENNDLVHVATVDAPYDDDADACEYAWRWTNNVEGSWSKKQKYFDQEPNGDFNEAVEVVAPLPVHFGKEYGLRSSMVGDVFEVGEYSPRCYAVASCGFREIGKVND